MTTPTHPLLRPCPFCGDAPEVYVRQDEDLWSHNQVNWINIRCTNCDIYFSLPESNAAEVYARWNKRPRNDASTDLNDAMKITNKPDAQAFIWRCVDQAMAKDECLSLEKAIQNTKDSVGYFAGYYGHDTRLRVEELFDCKHPFLPAAKDAQLTPQEILKLGMDLGEKLKKEGEERTHDDRHNG